MLKAIIVDDEYGCIETLRIMFEKKMSDEIIVVGATVSTGEATALVTEHQPDVVFLDIEMPGLNGIEWLQSLPQIHFRVIFTTAHEHYAVQAIKLNALDYLTKPINLEELQQAVQKLQQNRKQLEKTDLQLLLDKLKTGPVRKIAVTTGTVTHYIPVNEIIRAESQSNYSVIHFINRPKQVISKTLKELEEQLSEMHFLRVHHSHLVNLDYVIGYKNQDSGYLVMQGNDIVEISRRKKQEVLQRLNRL